MTQAKYRCTNCGHHFEAEERDGLECPLCFWSSSVQKDEESKSVSGVQSPAVSGSVEVKIKDSISPVIPWVGIIFCTVTLAVGVLIFVFAAQFRAKVSAKKLSVSLTPDMISDQPSSQTSEAGSSVLPGLSAEEQAVLNRKLQLSPDRPLTEPERQILEAKAEFKTGFAEKLPSQAWTMDQFQQMLKEQEQFYKIPLPGSYKRKLKKLFETHYVPASQAFQNSDLLQARDGWVSSLTFPVYANDIKKHRGVVLTMLRPFIADTLSKIGAINSILVEKKVRDREREVTEHYAQLLNLLENQKWQEAVSETVQLKGWLDSLENPKAIAGDTPPYPAALGMVDEDIRATLTAISEVPPPPVSAFHALRRDIDQKQQVAESFLPVRLEQMQKHYGLALDAISRQDWQEAERLLKSPDLPAALLEDARQKLEVIAKMKASAALPPVQEKSGG